MKRLLIGLVVTIAIVAGIAYAMRTTIVLRMMDRLVADAVANDRPIPVGPMTAGVITWFLVDSTASLAAGLPGNVVLNVSFLAFFAVPLVKLRR